MVDPNDTRFVIFDNTGAVINAIMAPSGYVDPYGNTAVASTTAKIGWRTSDQGRTFTPAQMMGTDLMSALNAAQTNVLAQNVWTFNVGTADAPVLCTTLLDDIGQNNMAKLILFGNAYANTTTLEPYSNVDFTPLNLTPAQCVSLGMKAGAIVSQTRGTLNELVAEIMNGKIQTLPDLQTAMTWPDPSQTY